MTQQKLWQAEGLQIALGATAAAGSSREIALVGQGEPASVPAPAAAPPDALPARLFGEFVFACVVSNCGKWADVLLPETSKSETRVALCNKHAKAWRPTEGEGGT